MSNQIVININRLGPVRDARITLGQFMIFSGASSLGKSYVAMLVHYVYRVLSGEEFVDFFREKELTVGDISRFDDTAEHEVFVIDTEELLTWIQKQARVYICSMLSYLDADMDVNFEFPKLPSKMCFYYRNVDSVEQDLPNFTPRGALGINHSGTGTSFSRNMMSQMGVSLYTQVLASYMASEFQMSYIGTTFLMPPARGAIMQVPLGSQLKVFESTPMYKEFLETFANIKAFKDVMPSTINTDLILDGQFDEKDGELIYNYHDVSLPISATASSIKEIAPFVLLAKIGWGRFFSTLFEEPESHLHPEMQIAVTDVMAQMIQQGMHLQITTHSDYVLRRINELLYLHMIKKAWNDEDKYNEFCEKRGLDRTITINPKVVKAYFFKAGENGLSSVVEQDLSDGIPFDTFALVLNDSLPISADIYEQFYRIKK